MVLSSSFIDNIDKFDSDGQYHLGQEYRNDQSVSESYWCFYKSALNGNINALEILLALSKQSDYAFFLLVLLKRAGIDCGSLSDQLATYVGVIDGKLTTLLELLGKRDKGLPDGRSFLFIGLLYENGWDVKRSTIAATHFYYHSAMNGNANAIYRLKKLSENGSSCAQDYCQRIESGEFLINGITDRREAFLVYQKVLSGNSDLNELVKMDNTFSLEYLSLLIKDDPNRLEEYNYTLLSEAKKGNHLAISEIKRKVLSGERNYYNDFISMACNNLIPNFSGKDVALWLIELIKVGNSDLIELLEDLVSDHFVSLYHSIGRLYDDGVVSSKKSDDAICWYKKGASKGCRYCKKELAKKCPHYDVDVYIPSKDEKKTSIPDNPSWWNPSW